MTTAGRQPYWIFGVFIYTVLLLLIAVPFLMTYRAGTIIADIDRFADPAAKAASRIQAELSHEAAAIVGFQTTGEDKYPYLYQEQSAAIQQSLSELEQLSPNFGPAPNDNLKQARAAIEAWHSDVARNNLVKVPLPPAQFQQLLFRHEYILEHAHETATSLNQAITTWRAEQRASVGNIARLSAMVSIGLAVLALVASVFINKMFRRLNETRSYLENRAKEEEGLRYVAHMLTGAFTLDEVLHHITERASLAAQAGSAYVELIDQGADEITCVAGYGAGVPATGTKGRLRGSLAEEVLARREPRIIRDVTSERDRRSIFGELALTCQNCTALVVPLITDSNPLGALFLIRRHPAYFRETEFPRVMTLAEMGALAIQRALIVERVRKMEAEERLLSEAAAILASSLDYKSTLQAVLQLLVPRMGDWCAIYLLGDGEIRTAEIVHADASKIRVAEALRKRFPPRLNGDSTVARVIRSGKSELHPEISDELLQQNAQNEEHLKLLRELNLGSAIVVPLTSAGGAFGALSLAAEQPGRYSADDLGFAEDLARHMASAIQNSRLYAASESAIRVRDEVLRIVSHDLRNPVSNIQMTAKMLMRGSLSEDEGGKLLEIIDRSAERMNRLIEDLIAVGRVREGQAIPLKLQPEHPGDVITEACRLFAAQARAKSIHLECDQPHMVPTVRADRHRLLQVFSNLLENAIKFTPEGGRITVSCQPHDDKVRFAVSDTGRGIEHQDLTKIFDLFWQAKPTAHLGSGFGLAIAKAIVEQHGGDIWAQSAPGLGTTFFFTLQQATGKEERLA